MTSSGSTSTKAGGAGASGSLTFPTRQLRGDPSKAHHRETEAAPEEACPWEKRGPLCGQD